MNRMGYFLILIMVTINAGLYVTGDITDFGAFRDLSSGLNAFAPVGATTDVNGFQGVSSASSPNTSQASAGIIDGALRSLAGIIKLVVFLMTGSIQLIAQINPQYTTGVPADSWGLIILVPIAFLQMLAILYLAIEVLAAITGALGRLI